MLIDTRDGKLAAMRLFILLSLVYKDGCPPFLPLSSLLVHTVIHCLCWHIVYSHSHIISLTRSLSIFIIHATYFSTNDWLVLPLPPLIPLSLSTLPQVLPHHDQQELPCSAPSDWLDWRSIGTAVQCPIWLIGLTINRNCGAVPHLTDWNDDQ